LISAVLGPEEGGSLRTAIDLINSSDEPVYRLVAAIVFIQGAGSQTIERLLEYSKRKEVRGVPIATVSILPPRGAFRVWIPGLGWSAR